MSETPHIHIIVKYCDPQSGGEGIAYRFCRYLLAHNVPFTLVCGRNKDPLGNKSPLAGHLCELGMLRPTRLLKYASFFYRAQKYCERLRQAQGLMSAQFQTQIHNSAPAQAVGATNSNTTAKSAPQKQVFFSFELVKGVDILRLTGAHSLFLRRSLEGMSPQEARAKARQRALNLYNMYLPRQERRAVCAAELRRIITPSRMSAAEIATQYPDHAPLVRVIPNGIDCARFTPPPTPEARQEAREGFLRRAQLSEATGSDYNSAAPLTLVGFAGSGFQRKGLANVIEALALLPPHWHLLVAGKDNAAPYTALAERLHIAPRVHFLGGVSDMPRFFHALDVFCLPTRYDPFGLVIAEALAASVPVVASTFAGSSELVSCGKTGYLVENLQADTLADALQKARALAPFILNPQELNENTMFAHYLAEAQNI